jgi:hypothetical protein
MQNYHLLPAGRRWKLTSEFSNSTIGEFTSKEEALDACIEFMRGRTGSLKIHKADGTIEEERTYPRAEDPVGSPG